MATATAIETLTAAAGTLKLQPQRLQKEPLKYNGSFDDKGRVDLTPLIGTEFPKSMQVSQILKAQNSDALLKELAVLISERGVVFLKDQDITLEQQQELAHRLGVQAGKPSTSHLHIHPLTPEGSERGDQIYVISSQNKEYGTEDRQLIKKGGQDVWHSDISYERIPSDYSTLKVTQLPPSGGDTLWASGYEVYDRLSKPYRKFLESLTATHQANNFHETAKKHNFKLRDPRGSPDNSDLTFEAVHPVVRTNPVTGWKSVYVNRLITKRINDVTEKESEAILDYIQEVVRQNHDLQVRYKWGKNDLAIWDNRSTVHAATFDYGTQLRFGERAVSLGERPYLDPNSKSRREALGEE
ncbi:hypothetical protein HK097_005203 [Rhizophlyctis rosea]|uniref:TauD/TfdA-like domain-containing protein n=1 Tax=Rhizophlyctis rosea TaxID=64517 RepID=A0AAD5X2K0_9FUNG|nr:hypothetical protein HK097_005203 [Rhizophlyctis rosea]